MQSALVDQSVRALHSALSTQHEAIERVHELNANDRPDVERVRHTSVGNRDKWRSAE